MSICAIFFIAISKILDIYMSIVFISAVISWVSPDPYNPIVRFLHAVTDPVLNPIRKVIGYRLGPIDISPMVVIVAILFVRYFLKRIMLIVCL